MKRLFLYFFVGLVLIGCFFKLSSIHNPVFIKPCSTYLIIYHEGGQLNLLIDFLSIQKNGSGILTVSGTYFKNDKKTGVMRRLVKFNWVALNQSYRLSASEIRKSKRDETLQDEDLELFLPDFFTHIGGRFDLTVAPIDDAGYLFSAGVRPLFFCEMTN